MARTESTMLPLGTPAPDFSLPECDDGRMVSLADFAAHNVLLVMFLSNHCPYVKHLADSLAALVHHYERASVGFVAIASNDIHGYPDDAPDKMKEEKVARDYTFPYVFDESQKVAHAYTAACTPDFFLFDKSRKLVYRGRFDETRPNMGTPHGTDLRTAIDAALAGQPPLEAQRPSMGCNIKWKVGNWPPYYG